MGFSKRLGEGDTRLNPQKIKIKQVIVVEGRSDTQNLQRFFDVKTIETNGSALSQETLNEIGKALDLYGVIVFTDPDSSGLKIRQQILSRYPNVQEAFIDRNKAKPKGKGSLGIEHASYQDLKEALEKVYEVEQNPEMKPYSSAQLLKWKLIGEKEAKERRSYLAKRLAIGYGNAKQYGKRLARFKISPEQIEQILNDFEEKHHG